MPVLVDPETGKSYDVPDTAEDRENAAKTYGLVSREDYALLQQGQQGGQLAAGARNLAAPILAAGQGIEGLLPEAISGVSAEQHAANVAATQPFFEQAKGGAAAFPLTALAAQAVPLGVLGAASGGAGAALGEAAGLSATGGAALGLGTESALTGVSQEAVDAITDKRDFSVQAALMKGGLNLLLGAVGHGVGRVLGGAEEAAGRAAARGAEGEAAAAGAVPGQRNILSELDPGEVPQAMPGGGRAMSGGAAAADFDDTVAAKAIKEIAGGEVDPVRVAEAAPRIEQHLGSEGARSLDKIDEIMRDEGALATKQADLETGAARWTPETIEAQNQWLGEMKGKTEALATDLENMKHVGGLGERGAETLRLGLERVEQADGAARNAAVDNMKRSIDGYINRIGNAGNAAVDQESRQALMNRLLEHADEWRSGLENPRYFGENAALQQAQNAALHELLEPWKRVQKRLYEITGREFEKTGPTATLRRADPIAWQRLLANPDANPLLRKDLGEALDGLEVFANAREEHGLSKLDRIPELRAEMQALKDDVNTAEVLQVAKEHAGVAGHGGATGDAAAGLVAGHFAEQIQRGITGLPLGRLPAQELSRLSKKWLPRARRAMGMAEPELVEKGTALGAVMDRYAERVKGNELLGDVAHKAKLTDPLRRFLDQAHAPARMPSGGGPGLGSFGGTPGTPPGAAAPQGGPANDVAGKVAAVAALGGGATLLAPGTASAASMPAVGPDGQTLSPAQAAARQAMAQQMAGLTPDEQAQHIRTAEAFARIGKAVEQRTSAAVNDLFTVAKNPDAAPRYQSRAARELDQRAAELGVPRATARFMGKNVDDPVQAWREKSQLLSSVVADPSRLASAMAANLGDLPKLQPQAFMQMVSQTMQSIEYLHDNLPAPSGKTTLMPNGYPPPESDIHAYAGRWVGTLHPLDTLDDLAANDVLPEQMQAVQDRWPQAYEMFRQSALGQIHQLSQKRGPIPLEALQQLDTALDLNGAGEPSLSGEMATLIQQATAQAAQQQKPPAAPSPMQSQAPARLASSSLGSLHDTA